MKKRVIALMLAFVLVLNMGTVAFANVKQLLPLLQRQNPRLPKK